MGRRQGRKSRRARLQRWMDSRGQASSRRDKQVRSSRDHRQRAPSIGGGVRPVSGRDAGGDFRGNYNSRHRDGKRGFHTAVTQIRQTRTSSPLYGSPAQCQAAGVREPCDGRLLLYSRLVETRACPRDTRISRKAWYHLVQTPASHEGRGTHLGYVADNESEGDVLL